MVYIYYDNTQFNNQIQYIFKVLFKILGLEIKFITSLREQMNEQCLIINYSSKTIDKNNTITIKPSYLFSDKYLKIYSMPVIPLNKYKGIPVIYTNYNEKTYVKKINSYIVTNIDIIQSAFFMLTRYEELLLWDKVDKDLYGRFPAKESLAYKEGFLDYPIVNEYIEWLWQWINSFNLGYKRKNTWGKYEFAACLTHDVDIPFKYNYSLNKDIKKFKIQRTFLTYKQIFHHTLSKINYQKDPFYTFDYIRNVEKKYKFNSSFYFMVGGNSIYDNFYKINDKRILKLINELDEDNCEVGYHYSFNSFDNLTQRKMEKEILDKYLNSKTYGGRNHYLRFKSPESWDVSEKVGLLYDTTLGYADIVGFRCGICMPYKVFDILQNKELNLWEIPLIVMEGSLKDKKYMNLNCDEAFEEIKKKIDIVKKYRGVFTLLWHNSSFDNESWKGWKEVFEDTMHYLYESNALGESGREIINIFTNKGD